MQSTYEQQESIAMNALSVVLIGPDDEARKRIGEAFSSHQAAIAGEMKSYPGPHQLEKVIRPECDVALVELDSDPDVALDLVENIRSRSGSITVMVYSRSRDPELLVRCMRAGAREFLSEPISSEALADALIRASARRLDLDRQNTASGKILVFWGAKGGCGVTTLAANFAIALRSQSAQAVALVDLHTELGDTAVALGIQPLFSISDALRSADRLDQEFVSTLLVEHKSGISVLAAPDQYSPEPVPMNGNLGKLFYLMRQKFPYVVVDAGPGLGVGAEALLETADAVYLVTEADIPALRNAQRLLSFLRRPGQDERVQVVVNRYDPRKAEIQEERIAKALDLPLRWKIPNEYASVRRALNAGIPLAPEHSHVARTLHLMAREACGKPAASEKKRKWDLF